MTKNKLFLNYKPIDIQSACNRFRKIDCPGIATNVTKWASKVRQIGGEPMVLLWRDGLFTLVAFRLVNPLLPMISINDEVLKRAYQNAQEHSFCKPIFFDEKGNEVISEVYV